MSLEYRLAVFASIQCVIAMWRPQIYTFNIATTLLLVVQKKGDMYMYPMGSESFNPTSFISVENVFGTKNLTEIISSGQTHGCLYSSTISTFTGYNVPRSGYTYTVQ